METQNDPSAEPKTGASALDNGLGVPPFRAAPGGAPAGIFAAGTAPAPTISKDSPMARPPFAQPTANPPMPSSATPRPPAPPTLRGPMGRDTQVAAPERRTLVVGRGISVQGMVQDAERLVVEGTVEASMIHAAELAVSPGGIFKGEIEVEDAEVAGTIDGTVTARGSLVVRATGVVLGTARCRRLQVEDGGQITGRIEMLTEGAPRQQTPSEPASRPAPSYSEA